MFYALRRHDGSRAPLSAGTWFAADGTTQRLANDAVVIEQTDHWISPRGDRYPSGWRLRVPRLELELAIRTVLDNQELDTAFRYWEGAVDVSGTRAARTLTGRGYVELTGYAR